MKKRRITIFAIGLLTVVFFIIFFNKKDNEWGFKKILPKTATEIKEYYWTDGFLPDYEYYLKAKISAKDFKDYCDTFALVLHTDSNKYTDDIGNLNTFGGSSDKIGDWWDSNSKQDSLFVWQGGDEWNIARYVNGYLYLYAHEH